MDLMYDKSKREKSGMKVEVTRRVMRVEDSLTERREKVGHTHQGKWERARVAELDCQAALRAYSRIVTS